MIVPMTIMRLPMRIMSFPLQIMTNPMIFMPFPLSGGVRVFGGIMENSDGIKRRWSGVTMIDGGGVNNCIGSTMICAGRMANDYMQAAAVIDSVTKSIITSQ